MKTRHVKPIRRMLWILMILVVYLFLALINRSIIIYRSISCGSRLESIGTHLPDYQQRHKGRNPEKLEQLIDESDMLSDLHKHCPCSRMTYTYRGNDLYEGLPDGMIILHDTYPSHRSTSGFLNLLLFEAMNERVYNVLFTSKSGLGTATPLTAIEFESALKNDNQLRENSGLRQK